jgi:hypothetical protein
MLKDSALLDKTLLTEKRLTKVEVSNLFIQDELKEIKRTQRWIIGIIFSLNSTIIGMVAKGFNLI